jgi:polyisoprenoid-binding protein YceI
MRKTLTIIIVIIALGVVGFVYATRPVKEPTVDVQSVSETLPQNTTPAANENVYRISQENSTVSFSATEVLNGKPFSPVGVTKKIAGDISVTTGANPKLTIGTLKIDARTFKTDSTQRDGAITRFILKSETAGNEYIEFKPTSVSGLPSSVEVNQDLNFTISGNLTIAGVTKPATFTVKAKVGDTTVTGTATTTVKRSDYNLNIPSVPFVANVGDDIKITATISATKV